MNNNPVRWIDPTGNSIDCAVGEPGCRTGQDIGLVEDENITPSGVKDYLPFDSTLGGNNLDSRTIESCPIAESTTCPGAFAAGALLIIGLAPIDYGLAIANIEITTIPVIGPIVEVLILVPVYPIVIDLHFVAASIMWQSSQRPCNEIDVSLLPPWGFDR
jgi:hypothetical protein